MKKLNFVFEILFTGVLFTIPGICQQSLDSYVPRVGREIQMSRQKSISAQGYGVVQPLYLNSVSPTAVVGSATAICFPGQPNVYFITASHVVRNERTATLQTAGQVDVVLNDPMMDFALLRSSRPHTNCLQLPQHLVLQAAYDPFLLNFLRRQEVRIEAYHYQRQQIVHAVYDSTLGATVYGGLLGHDFTGPLVVSSTIGLPGMSGGALMSIDRDSEGQDGEVISSTTGDGDVRFYGMILASSFDGEKVFALGTPIIRARLLEFFRGRTTTSRAQYQDQRFIDASIGLEIPSTIVAPAGLHDFTSSGRFRTGDSGRFRTGDSGRFRTGDSGVRSLNSRGTLIAQQKIWHAVENLWSEGAVMNFEIRRVLAQRRDLRGIFESPNGNLVRTNSDVAVPTLFNFQWAREYWDQLEDFSNRAAPCVRSLGTMRKKGNSRIRYMTVVLCEQKVGNDQTNFMVMLEDPLRSVSAVQIHGIFQFRGNELFQSIEISRPRGTLNLSGWNYQQLENEFTRANGATVLRPAKSLRVFDFASAQLIVEDNGPLQFYSTDEEFEVLAPAHLDALPSTSVTLNSRVDAEEFVSSYLQALEIEQNLNRRNAPAPRARR